MMRINFWSGLATTVFSVLLLTWVIPQYGGGGFSFGLPPQLVASIGAWVILLFAGLLVVTSLINMKKAKEPVIVGVSLAELWHHVWPFLYVLIFICLAIFFPLTWIAPFLIGFLLFILGERRWTIYLICTGLPTLGLYILTVYLMRIGVV